MLLVPLWDTFLLFGFRFKMLTLFHYLHFCMLLMCILTIKWTDFCKLVLTLVRHLLWPLIASYFILMNFFDLFLISLNKLFFHFDDILTLLTLVIEDWVTILWQNIKSLYLLFFVLVVNVCDHVGWLESVLTVDVLIGTDGLNEASSHRVDFFLLGFHSVPKSLYLRKSHDHGNKILIDSVLLVGVCC